MCSTLCYNYPHIYDREGLHPTSQFVVDFSIMAPSHSKKNVIVESLISGDRSGVGGVLCNDTSGLCLISEGTMKGTTAGAYTSLARLASQLSPHDEGNVPLITLESKSYAVLVKEYDGRTVAIQVPSGDREGASSQPRPEAPK